MSRAVAALLLSLLALSCQQREGGDGRVAPPPRDWLVDEERLSAEVSSVAPQLEALAREGNVDVQEALQALRNSRDQLHKTRVTVLEDLSRAASNRAEGAAFEQTQKAADERMALAISRVERHLERARQYVAAARPTVPKAEKKTEEQPQSDEPAPEP